MRKFCLLFITIMIVSCEKEEVKPASEKVADSNGPLIEKAKETEAFLQKQVDSIVSKFDSLGVPR